MKKILRKTDLSYLHWIFRLKEDEDLMDETPMIEFGLSNEDGDWVLKEEGKK